MVELVTGSFAVWFALSVIVQFPVALAYKVREYDVMGLLPSWSFFAPNPARTDVHLVYRHVLKGGSVCAWTEAFVWTPPWYRAIWNPDKRAEKAISDACGSLAAKRTEQGVRLSVGYLLLLNFVSHLPRLHGAEAVQFALLGSYGSADAADFARFVSDVHPLEGT